MKSVKYTYWKDGGFYIGYLNDYPDYQTQGLSKEELAHNLKDLLKDIESEEIPYIRKVEELVFVRCSEENYLKTMEKNELNHLESEFADYRK